MSNLNVKAWLGLIFLTIIMGLLLFVPAGTVHYWQAWVFLAVFFGASIVHTLHLIKHDPALLKRRLSGGPMAEQQTTQKVIMLFTSIGFIALLVLPALDHRLGWSVVARTHRSLNKDAPTPRPVQRIGRIASHALVGGLHHRYVRI